METRILHEERVVHHTEIPELTQLFTHNNCFSFLELDEAIYPTLIKEFYANLDVSYPDQVAFRLFNASYTWSFEQFATVMAIPSNGCSFYIGLVIFMEGSGGINSTSPVRASSSRFAHEYIDIDDSEVLPTSDEPDNINGGEHASVGEENEENYDEEDELVLNNKRRKTSSVWDEFVVVTLKNGQEKVECIHYPYLECEKPSQLTAPNAKYDPNKMREAIAAWIMGTEQPFNVVEDDLFVWMIKTANPLFEKVSRVTTKADCIKVYENERKRLKSLTNITSTISLTTDCWKSSHQRIEYMVITGHFIDYKWRLHKRVLNFVHVPPPRIGRDIADGIYKCLKDWGIEDKVFSISVDNASYNDRVVETLRKNFSLARKFPCKGRLLHVRCCAHIMNICVKDGLSKIDHVIEEVREAVKYINYSEARTKGFASVAHQLKVDDRKLLIDVPTRWNSTYDMLSLALKFKDVFPSYAEYEVKFQNLPTEQDWENVAKVCEILKVFKVCTTIISGSHYPTSNLYLIEVYKVKQVLDDGARSEDHFIRDMVKAMKAKFDKYWGECHLLMAIASVLDPRFKKWLIGMSYHILYAPDQAVKNIKEVEDALEDMYNEYREMHDASVKEAATNGIGY
ncbi:zinc finger BED domain-containing protein RICESLEEPER 2-like [Rutidosis leptorrhynchoides]|uniref:zinc finger BED domain-containing protein RICESLEEPER 2-like n=1 Tax=Rutidosis leptorrhynchoides TaxID=125765 RepID=UPI003A990BE0